MRFNDTNILLAALAVFLLQFSHPAHSQNAKFISIIQDQEILVDSVFGKKRGGVPILETNYKQLFSPDGRHLYWFYSGAGLLAVFAREADSGRLTKTQVLRNGAEELNGFSIPNVVAIPPDGKHLYGGRGNHSNILVLARDFESGKIAYVDSSNISPLPTRNWEVGSLVASSNNSTILVTDYVADKCLIFTRDPSTGKLQLASDVILNAPDRLVVSSNGVDIYLLHYDFAKYLAAFQAQRRRYGPAPGLAVGSGLAQW